MLLIIQGSKKNDLHWDFTASHLHHYYLSSTPLDFRVRMGSGMLDVIWQIVIASNDIARILVTTILYHLCQVLGVKCQVSSVKCHVSYVVQMVSSLLPTPNSSKSSQVQTLNPQTIIKEHFPLSSSNHLSLGYIQTCGNIVLSLNQEKPNTTISNHFKSFHIII